MNVESTLFANYGYQITCKWSVYVCAWSCHWQKNIQGKNKRAKEKFKR